MISCLRFGVGVARLVSNENLEVERKCLRVLCSLPVLSTGTHVCFAASGVLNF